MTIIQKMMQIETDFNTNVYVFIAFILLTG